MPIDDNLVDMLRQMLTLMLKIVAPILGTGIAIGLSISIFQSVTSIQDQTLTFVPKIFGMVIVVVILMAWIAQRIGEFAIQMFTFA